ncbi:MAG: SRPBCC family protein [Anaerolineaceae bacterium]
MIYRHKFRVHSALTQVAEFHSRATSMPAITPPPMVVSLHNVPDILSEGDEMDFTLKLGPIPIHWLARIEDVSLSGFTDRQIKGPFKEWIHRHSFIVVNDKTTEVKDEITLSLSSNPLWWLVGIGMRAGLPLLFAFRAWKTKRLLQ